MLQKEHMKQASVKKVCSMVEELYTIILLQIDSTTGYLNEVEKCMCALLLSDSIQDACNEIFGKETISQIRDYVSMEKERLQDEREKDIKEKWRFSAI